MRGVRVAYINSELSLVYDQDRFIGSVRKGMDHQWYPELPSSRSQKDAVADVVRAYDSMRKYADVS